MECETWGVTEIVAAIRDEIARARSADDFDADAVIERFVKVDPPGPSAAFDGYIDTISIAGVRSFGPKQTLRPSRGLTIVYGDNGTGKTSLVDGLELLMEGETTRRRSGAGTTGEVKDAANIPHVRSDGSSGADEVCVAVAWADGAESSSLLQSATWDGKFGPRPARSLPVQVLARRRLREHLVGSGSDRAEHLGTVVGLMPAIAVIRGVRAGLIDHQKNDEAPCTASPLAPVYEFVAAQGIFDRISSMEELRSWAVGRLDGTEKPAADLDTPLINLLDSFPRAELEQILGLWGEADPIASLEPADTDDLLTMLTLFVEVASPERQCPACENGTVTESRLGDIRARIERETERIERVRRRESLVNRTRSLLTRMGEATRGLPELPLAGADAAADTVRNFRTRCDTLRQTRSAWLRAAASIQRALDSASRGGAAEVEALRATTAEWTLTDQRFRMELDEVETLRRDALNEFRNSSAPDEVSLRAIVSHAEQIWAELERKRREQFEKDCLGRAADALKRHETRVVDALFNELAEPINEWLTLLSPGNTPSIRLKAKATAGRPALSVLVAGEPRQVHAVGRLSDSQLDMLGLAAHLASIERQQPGATIVIDDPSDMLDGTTRAKLASAGIARLLDETNGAAHQVIVMTHDDALVRELWDAHRARRPATLQYYIETECDSAADDRFAVVTPRNTATALERAWGILHGDGGKSHNLLWFRASLATSVRQAMEMLCKDIAAILGPSGLSRTEPISEDRTHGAVSKAITPELRRMEEAFSVCGNPRHSEGRRILAELLDVIDSSRPRSLNSAAHADVVSPTVAVSKTHLTSLGKVAQLVVPPAGTSQCSWTTDSELAKALQECRECNRPVGS
ncbi:ATP-binding protein [Rhodococcus yananensis]|uniref:ATP-binding protein n=1 Tax=Rhodococcus yananensis TaxID=2879464 RepID=UPI001CF85368|nr:ATP-binding protein [Rhodococcus yananensis]